MRLPINTRLGGLALGLLLLASAAPSAKARGLDVEVWTDRGDDAVYHEGDAMRIKVRATDDAYLLVYEIDVNGNVNLLYPIRRGSSRIEGRRTLKLPDDVTQDQLVVEKETGQGFIVALASERPFRDFPWFLRPYDPQAASMGYEDDSDDTDHDEEGFDDRGRVVGDPYVAMERIRRRVLAAPGDDDAFASAYTTYYVHEQVRYPRYLCNDCHRPSYWAWWDGFDPYYARCSVFDFRVNWNWYWGPPTWNAYVPYYFFCVRTDCPPRFQPWAINRARFSSWDGWHRWNDLWGGDLRRFKPGPAPVTYSPPPPRGVIWRQGQTPPGFVPPDVRRQGASPGSRPLGWLQRDRGDGRPVWRDPRPDGPGQRPDVQRWRQGGATPAPQGGGEPGTRERTWRGWDHPRGGDTPAPPAESGDRGPRVRGEGGRPFWRPGGDSPRPDPPAPPPRHDPPRGEQGRGEPVYRQPPSQSEPSRGSQAPQKPEGARGRGGKG